MFRHGTRAGSGRRTLAACSLTLGGAVLLAALPDPLVLLLRGWQRQCLLPAQKLLLAAGGESPVPAAESADPARVAEAREELQRYRAEVEAAVQAALARLEGEHQAGGSQPLLVPTALRASIIGRQGRSFFEHTVQLDVGLADAVLPHAWVLNPDSPLLDQGSSAGLEQGHLVLAGRSVWGQVRDVGAHASTVQRVTAAGYRDVVQLAGDSASSTRQGPRGILEGIGQAQCRVRMVKSTEPVEVGDLVLSDGGDELLPTPLIYGRIARAERQRGAVHWELWMEPAAAETPDRLAVVRLSLNAARLARATSAAPSGDLPSSELSRQ